jgi:hypothetical protein
MPEEDVYIKLAEAVSMRCEENLKNATANVILKQKI